MPLLLRKKAPSPSIDELIVGVDDIDINRHDPRRKRPKSEKSQRVSQRARSKGADNIEPKAVRELEFEMKVMHKTSIGKFIARRRNAALLSKRRKNPQIGDFEDGCTVSIV